MPSRAGYERETIEAILDEAIVSHVGTVSPAGHPVVIPTLHARAGDWLYIHGSAASPTLRRAEQAEICLTATLLDGLVLARSAVHHSVNYRSVVVFGQAEKIESPDGQTRGARGLHRKARPRPLGRRPPAHREGAARRSAVLRLPLDEASAKVRSGGPLDDDEDYELPVWAGTIGPATRRQLTPARRAPPPDIELPQLPNRPRKRPNLRPP